MELNRALLREVPAIEGRMIAQFHKELETTPVEPLGGESTSSFLRRIVQGGFTDGAFLDGKVDSVVPNRPTIYRKPVIFLRQRSAGLFTMLDAILEELASADKELPEGLSRIVGIEGEEISVPASTDAAARRLAVFGSFAKKSGMVDPVRQENCKRPLADHLSDFRRYLEAQGNAAKHARQTCNRVQAVLDGCKFRLTVDLSASALVEWLAGERAAGRMGIQTSNYYLRDTKAFCRWLVKDRHASENPLAYVSGMNAQVEVGMERRALPVDDFAALVEAARNGKTVRKVAGPDRAVLYTIAAYTGLRESELVSLIPESFDLTK